MRSVNAVPLLPLFPLLLVLGCSSGSASHAAPVPPALLQYVGEYDAAPGSAVERLVLHVDGTYEATTRGQTTTGTFAGSGANDADGARAALTSGDGSASTVAFRIVPSESEGPSRVALDLSGAIGASTLTSPWLAGDEDMCDATRGRWTDDDPDPETGLYCVCATQDLYLPSRGGCVASVGSGDPPRLPLDEGSRAIAGHYTGTGDVSVLVLDEDGTYSLSTSTGDDSGTWWPTGAPGALAFTSAAQALYGTAASGDVTLDLGDHAETLEKAR
jgi:hypothetical protein